MIRKVTHLGVKIQKISFLTIFAPIQKCAHMPCDPPEVDLGPQCPPHTCGQITGIAPSAPGAHCGTTISENMLGGQINFF